jgi:hypothetical protein
VLPVLGREVVEGQQRVAVLHQLGCRLVPLHAVDVDEVVEGGRSSGAGLGLPASRDIACRNALPANGCRADAPWPSAAPISARRSGRSWSCAANSAARGSWRTLHAGPSRTPGHRRRWPAWGPARGHGA